MRMGLGLAPATLARATLSTLGEARRPSPSPHTLTDGTLHGPEFGSRIKPTTLRRKSVAAQGSGGRAKGLSEGYEAVLASVCGEMRSAALN